MGTFNSDRNLYLMYIIITKLHILNLNNSSYFSFSLLFGVIVQQTNVIINVRQVPTHFGRKAFGDSAVVLKLHFNCKWTKGFSISSVSEILKGLEGMACYTGQVLAFFLLPFLCKTQFQIKGERLVCRRDIFDVSGKRYK